jgi:hypothetical protein
MWILNIQKNKQFSYNSLWYHVFTFNQFILFFAVVSLTLFLLLTVHYQHNHSYIKLVSQVKCMRGHLMLLLDIWKLTAREAKAEMAPLIQSLNDLCKTYFVARESDILNLKSKIDLLNNDLLNTIKNENAEIVKLVGTIEQLKVDKLTELELEIVKKSSTKFCMEVVVGFVILTILCYCYIT